MNGTAPAVAQTQRTQNTHSKLAYGLMALAAAAYIVITWLSPVSDQTVKYNLSNFSLHLLQLSVTLPVIVIWFAALWGSLKFKRYAASIYLSPDGRALYRVANGLIFLVSGLVATTLLQSMAQRVVGTGHIKEWSIFTNHFALLAVLVAFVWIYQGAKPLAAMVKFKDVAKYQMWIFVFLAIVGGLYAWLVAKGDTNPSAQQLSKYYLPVEWTLLTIVLPYIVTWYFGLMAAAFLRSYRKNAPGIIYRRAVHLLANGLVAIIGASLLIQIFTSLGGYFAELNLASVLISVYVLIVIYGLGHIMVAIGARKLQKIEEIS